MKLLTLLFILIFSLSAFGQEILTNKDVIEMSRGGISATVIAAKIKNSKPNFDTSVEALKTLAEAKVSNEIISLMLGTTASIDIKSEFKTLAITEWVGERFIFHPTSPGLQKYGYQSISSSAYRTLPYQEYVGKVVKINSVTPSSTGVTGAYLVDMVVEGSGERLRAEAIGGNVRGLVLMSDIEKARRELIGKNLWRQQGSLSSYDLETNKFNTQSISPFEPLKVLRIEPAWYTDTPIRIWLRSPNNQEGYMDVSFSGTNISEILRDNHRFLDEFQMTQPKGESPEEASRSFKPSVEALKLADAGKDVLGWQQGWWGMTNTELISVFKDAKKLSARSSFNSMYVDYAINEYQVGTDILKVSFQMNTLSNRLQQVLISAPEVSADRLSASVFERLEVLLTQKYGIPIYNKDKSEKTTTDYTRQWVFPTTTIELNYFFIDKISSRTTIRYFPTKTSDANKL